MKLKNEQLIKKWEELRLLAYLPTRFDVPTIGWGHTKGVKLGTKITKEKAQEYFEYDVAWAQTAVNTLVEVDLSQHQFDALVSFVFNIGEGKFSTSTLLRKLNAGDYEGAAEQLPRWNKQKGRVLRGLVRRRAEEMVYFLASDLEWGGEHSRPEAPASDILKPLIKSKEMITGVGATVTGVVSAVGGLSPKLQEVAPVILVVALVGFGLYIVYNRLMARKVGDR